MKLISRITLLLFALILVLPLVNMNLEPDVVSAIDNRKLAPNPFQAEGDLTRNIDAYISDRIGFRNEMILAYTVANDALFDYMVHPTYMYGKDGYIFFNDLSNHDYCDFYDDFADLVLRMQTYCDERGIPFVFAFEPSKATVLQEYLPEGLNYQNDWVEQFLAALEERGVRYVDNTVTMNERLAAGEEVFNVKYDAGHWNSLGAFYGVNAILEALHAQEPSIVPNRLEEFENHPIVEESLQVSAFPIRETVPWLEPRAAIQDVAGAYAGEIRMDHNFHSFGYYVNPEKAETPRTLVFQGSYMNGYGYPFFSNALGEYIHVHNYENVLNLPYYLQLFQPECVVFEVTEYALTGYYFDPEGVRDVRWNPVLADRWAQLDHTGATVPVRDFGVSSSAHFTTVLWQQPTEAEHAWLVSGGQVFDLWRSPEDPGVYETVLPSEAFTSAEEIRVVTELGGVLTVHTPV